MKNFISGKWLLLIHQIPPKLDAFRVKIWRRLQQVGAVAIKPSVYAMPFSDQSREDLSWTLREAKIHAYFKWPLYSMDVR